MNYVEFGGTEESTIAEVHEWILDNLEDGVVCPACSQYARMYKRSLNSGMARDLIMLYGKYGMQLAHTGRDVFMDQSRGLSKLRFWGLTQMGDSRGFWQVTPAGKAFLQNQLRVPKVIWTYNQRMIKVDRDTEINVIGALHNKFNYNELMGGSDGLPSTGI